MTEMEDKELKWENYGYVNGWSNTPERVKLAKKDPEAKVVETKIGRSEYKYTCEKYKFTYYLDCSD